MRNSATARLAIMALLAIGLIVPQVWVESIVSERASRRSQAVAEISSTWAGPQTIAGPILSVPYTTSWIDTNGRPQRSSGRAYFLPRDVHVEGTVATELRRRGIFDVPVYRATLALRGRFERPDLSWIRPQPDHIDWDRASVQFGLSDPHGVARQTSLSWHGRDIPFSGGTDDTVLFQSGLHAPIPSLDSAEAGADLPFAVALELNGTRDLRFLPDSGETNVALASAWPHPSFSGTALPETRHIADTGFTAQWRVQDFGRAYPAQWTSGDMSHDQMAARAGEAAFGVSLVQPIDIYQQADRAVKYAVLFIVLTFMVFFLWEVFSATLLHPMQYAFVGFAMCVFYLLLLSIAEHTGFDPAYAIASSVTTLLVTGYARAVLRGRRAGASVLASLTLLYGFLYLLLRLEDYALLAGSVGLFLVLAVVMFVTRRMNWYEMKLGERAAISPAAPAAGDPSA